MYIAAGITILCWLFLLMASRKEETGKKGVLKPFYQMGCFLYKKACVKKLPIFMDKQVEKDLVRLYPGRNKAELCAEYYVKKIALSICMCLAGTFLGVILSINAQREKILSGDGEIRRKNYLEQPQEIQIKSPHWKEPFSVTVEEEKLTTEEANALYQVFWEELQQKILGENLSFQEVVADLHLMDAMAGYPFVVEWESEMPDVISSFGKREIIEKEERVLLRATVTYKDMEWQEEIEVHLVPMPLSREEQQHRSLQEILESSEMESREEEVWKLPESYQGEKIVWQQVVKDDSLLLWGGMLIVILAVYFLSDKDLHDTLGKRKEQMKREYPDIVQKLVLYMGAGMTIRRAFQKIAGDYEHRKVQGGRQYPAYEEMLYTCRELQAGISEGAAYEHFGKRTGLQEYIRLCTLLQQNLKKGSSTLLARLREEADKAALEKMQGSKRRGEEAATKLLLPMVMMLLTIMIIIMIPAFSSTIM